LTLMNRDKIFPHEINFDEGDLKCLETPHTEILGNGERLSKKVQLKDSNAEYAKPFVDHTTGGGPSVYLKSSGKRNLGNIGILSLDTMGIQGFIGEAEKLKMLRGGSFLVDHILDLAAGVVSKYVCKEAILFKGGGNMLALVPDTEKCRTLLEKEIEKCIINESRGGLKAAVVTFSTELDKVAGNFNVVLDESQKQLDLKKNCSYLDSIIPNEKEICKYCSTRPLPPSSDMCQVCTIKNQHGEAEKWRMSKKYIDKVYGARRPTEISHLGNSIGALMIDGNMMGRMFQQTTTPAEYTFKSQSFAQRFDRILKDTINEFLEDEQKRNELVMHSVDNETYIGIEVVYSGGDDVLILMNAKGVIQFAELFINNIAKEFTFEKKFHDGTQLINPVITVSGGIAISDSKFPIYFLLNAARMMESRSKEAFRNETETDERGIIRLPNGSIAITGISAAMPTGDYSIYVMDNGKSGSLLQLKEMISIALNKSSTALLSDIITCGSSEHERLNLIKYMYSSLQRKSSGIGLDQCEWMADVLRNPELLEASRMIIPHILHSSREGEA
ncbi:MAG: Cas10/Cmr2 second palm domain-containing protein, partial [Halobacteriota archaeon]